MTSPSDILQGKVLIVDDQEVNVLLLERMLRGAGYVSIASTTDPREVRALHVKERYDLILLDIQMPGIDGFQVMEGLKDIEPSEYLPVLVITAQPSHKLRALEAGAMDFIGKPFEVAEVLARVRNMLEVRLLHRELHSCNDVLERQVSERTADLQGSYLETVFALTRAAEHKDEDVGAHVRRISYYCRELATMLGMDTGFVARVFISSPMHDVGKIGIPDHVLLKPGELDVDEREVMKGHSQMGWKILGDSKSPILTMGAEIALNHHERWCGGGYPNDKRGEAIPFAARIMSVCDVYDALRSKRPYKPALDHATTMDIMTRGDGRTRPEHFDPVVLDGFDRNGGTFSDIFDACAV